MDTEPVEVADLEWYDRHSGCFLSREQGRTYLVEFELDPDRPNDAIGVISIRRWDEAETDGEPAGSGNEPPSHAGGVEEPLALLTQRVRRLTSAFLLNRFGDLQGPARDPAAEHLWVRIDWSRVPVEVTTGSEGSASGLLVFQGEKSRAETFARSLKLTVARLQRQHTRPDDLIYRLETTLKPLADLFSDDPLRQDTEHVSQVVAAWAALRSKKRDDELIYDLLSASLLEGVAAGWAKGRISSITQTRTVFDSKRFREDHPELWAQYCRTAMTQVLSLRPRPEGLKPGAFPDAGVAAGGQPVPAGARFASFSEANNEARRLLAEGLSARVKRTEGGFVVVRG